jgi:hypothetical protein
MTICHRYTPDLSHCETRRGGQGYPFHVQPAVPPFLLVVFFFSVSAQFTLSTYLQFNPNLVCLSFQQQRLSQPLVGIDSAFLEFRQMAKDS